MHRRQFLHAAAMTATAMPLVGVPALAQSTPAPSGDDSLTGRVSAVAPEAMLEALLTTPVTTPLLPVDTPPVEPAPWDDLSDVDLAGAVGGVLFQTGFDANDNPLAIANAMVHPDADAATAALANIAPEDMDQWLGMPWFVQAFDEAFTPYAVSAVQVGYLLMVGGAESLADGPSSVDGATPEREPSLELRAISYMTAMLDHMEDVLASLEA